MGKIFVGQTKLTIKLDLGSIPTDVNVAKIKYIKPNDVVGDWTAIVNGRNIFYHIDSVNDLDVNGLWSFYAHITYNDSKIMIGEVAKVIVHKQGK